MPTDLRVGGLTRLSSCDWPGELVATAFCQGCAWRCPYCHNADLQPVVASPAIAWADVLAFLKTRIGLLDGVVFSGGEPLLQGALVDTMRAVRDLGFRVGLHTGGAVPSRFADVLPLTDWVGFDVKAPFDAYIGITGSPNSGADARESLKLLLASGTPHEIRTTVHPRLLDGAALSRMAEELAGMGVECWVLQEFRSRSDVALAVEAYTEGVRAQLQACSVHVAWR
jgi:pyruvate formate lyase activating enzyme